MTTTPELVAALAAAERELADRFQTYGIPDPDEKAAALMRWLKVTGWRLNVEEDNRPREEWRPVPGWEGRYEVSDMGRVRSFVAPGRPPGFVMKPVPRRVGYLAITFRHRGFIERWAVHRLVATVFCPPRPGGIVRHLDGNSLNNVASNLSWGSTSENQQDAVRHGTQRNTRKTECDNGHEYTPENTGRDRGRRRCLTCHRDKQRDYQARTRAVQRAAARAAKAAA